MLIDSQLTHIETWKMQSTHHNVQYMSILPYIIRPVKRAHNSCEISVNSKSSNGHRDKSLLNIPLTSAVDIEKDSSISIIICGLLLPWTEMCKSSLSGSIQMLWKHNN